MVIRKLFVSSIFIILAIGNNSYSFTQPLEDEKILKLLINGKYNKKTKYIKHDLSKDNIKKYQLENVFNFSTAIIFKKEFKQDKKLNYIVVTETRDETSDCHACAPIVGIAVFEKTGTNFKIKDKFQYVERIGTWGHAPTPQLKEIGKNNYGLIFESNYFGMGITSSSTTIIGKINNKFESLHTENTEEDNNGACGNELKVECYSYTSKLDFMKNNEKFYPISFTYKGTSLDNNDKAIPYNKVKKYKFLKNKYVSY
ncbi:MAG: hypothetical protein U0354_07555 [Candidatus Sericytochromatia bacterium]